MSPRTPTNLTNSGIRKDLDSTKERFDKIMGLVITVLGLGFIALLVAVLSPIIDAWRFRTATYQTLVDKVNAQSEKIDLLIRQLESASTTPEGRIQIVNY